MSCFRCFANNLVYRFLQFFRVVFIVINTVTIIPRLHFLKYFINVVFDPLICHVKNSGVDLIVSFLK